MAGIMDKVSDFFFKNEDDIEGYNDFSEPVGDASADKAAYKPQEKKAVKKTNLISVPSKSKNADNYRRFVGCHYSCNHCNYGKAFRRWK